MTTINITKELRLMPIDAMEPMSITFLDAIGCSLAGSVGKKVSSRKPGINEDAGSIHISDDGFIFAIMIDGHFDRDTTEILMDQFSFKLSVLSKYSNFESFTTFVKSYYSNVLNELQINESIGEASFLIMVINLNSNELYYYSIGDVMMFVFDPRRSWGKYFQISNRHYYEWIGKSGSSGEHFGKLSLDKSFEIIVATDGLIDEPVISLESIKNIFANKGSEKIAYNLVKYALDNNEEDDNITVMHFDLYSLIENYIKN